MSASLMLPALGCVLSDRGVADSFSPVSYTHLDVYKRQIPRVSNVGIFSLKLGWYALILMNAAVILGTISLMAGINNAGGEYREYIWPVMALFAAGIALTLYNFLKTIAMRKTKEIYVSNWYIISAVMYVIVILLVAYLPFWQHGLAAVSYTHLDVYKRQEQGLGNRNSCSGNGGCENFVLDR